MTRFYAVTTPAGMAALDDAGSGRASVGADVPFSQNVGVARLPLAAPAAFHASLVAGLVRGTTLWLDFPFPAFPENMGHWAEALAPTYSVLADGAWRRRCSGAEACDHVTALLFPNLHREQVQVRQGAKGGGSRGAAGCCRAVLLRGGAGSGELASWLWVLAARRPNLSTLLLPRPPCFPPPCPPLARGCRG